MGEEEEDRGGLAEYASPPCFMHELTEDYRVPAAADAQAAADVYRWRKAERQRQIEARLAISAAGRAVMTEGIVAGIDKLIGGVGGRLASYYWPFRGEPDLRPWGQTIVDRGGRTALPLVVAKGQPLVFREWKQGEKLERGVWNIPIPGTREVVTPDALVIPLVGFDAENYRLGYGGGYYDRTLAAMARRPFRVGLGYAEGELPTIYPQPHDIPMDLIVTDQS